MTALSDLQAGHGQFGIVIAIEGYEYLLVSGASEANVETKVTDTSGQGWNGGEWSSALAGLEYLPLITRTLKPFDDKLDVPTMAFRVQHGLHSDQFGTDVFKVNSTAGNQTQLATALDCDDTTVTVDSTTGFASSGSIWIGTERIDYTGTTATTFTGCTRGKYAPFGTQGGTANRFGRGHDVPAYDYHVAYKPRVTDTPRTWVGRDVGVWLHSIHGGVWGTKADAALLFAGVITQVGVGASGNTFVQCEDMMARVRNTILLRDQFRGRVKEGLDVTRPTTSSVEIACGWASTFNINGPTYQDTANDFEIVASESTTQDIEEGYYAPEELCSEITEWLTNDGDLVGNWTVEVVATQNGPRTRLTVDLTGTGYVGATICTLVLAKRWAAFLGFTGGGSTSTCYNELNASLDEGREIEVTINATGTGAVYSQEAPARIWIDLTEDVQLDASVGTWVDLPQWLPQEWQDGFVGSSEKWGVLQVGEKVFALARKVSDVQFEIRESEAITRRFGGQAWKDVNHRIESTAGGSIEVRQIVVLSGSFADIISRLFYSTGTTDFNSTNAYDRFEAQLGAAVPGELLGATFEDSMALISDASQQDALSVVLEKPTRLEEALGMDILLRSAHLTFNQGYVWTTMSPLLSGLAQHTLTENNKRSALAEDPQRSTSTISRRHIRNVVSLEYNRDLTASDEYQSRIHAVDLASTQAYGERPIRLRMRNSYAGEAATGDTIEALTADMVGGLVPSFRAPLMVIRRTIGPAHYLDVQVGDVVTVSDNLIRNPETGARGIEGLPGRILSHTYGLGGADLTGSVKDMFGEVEIILAATTDEALYSPAAFVSTYSDPTLTLVANTFNKATEANDYDEFANGDKVRIVERDPTDPTSPEAYAATLASKSGSTFDVGSHAGLTTGIAAGKSYVMIPADYATVVADQKDTAYQADSDSLVSNARQPFVWSDLYQGGSFTGADLSHLPESYADEFYGDGVPITPHQHRAAAVFLTNYLNYKSTIHIPWSYSDGPRTAPTTQNWELLEIHPFSVHPGILVAGTQRQWNVQPQFKASSANQVEVRVTFALAPPNQQVGLDAVFVEPFRQLTFTTSSTTYVVATAQTQEAVFNPESGECFIIVEGRSSAAHGAQLNLLGFPTFYLGTFS